MNTIKFWTESVLAIPGEESVLSAAKRMHVKDVSSLLILAGKKPVGIITERDIVQTMAKEIDPIKTKVSDVMSTNLVKVKITDDLEKARSTMLEHNFGHILVVDENDDLVGLASLRDLERIWKKQEVVRVVKFGE
jgi:CBS domain-containing protein